MKRWASRRKSPRRPQACTDPYKLRLRQRELPRRCLSGARLGEQANQSVNLRLRHPAAQQISDCCPVQIGVRQLLDFNLGDRRKDLVDPELEQAVLQRIGIHLNVVQSVIAGHVILHDLVILILVTVACTGSKSPA